MNIIPKNKYDLETVSSLDKISNSEIEPYLTELLIWVQDMNWPVAKPIANRLSDSGSEIVNPINNILRSEDDTWKYHIIVEVIENLRKEIREELMPEIIRIINNPTNSERLEEVDLVARDIMVMCSHGISQVAQASFRAKNMPFTRRANARRLARR